MGLWHSKQCLQPTHVGSFLFPNLLYLLRIFATGKHTKDVLNLQVLPLTPDAVVTSLGTKQMQMLDHVRNLVKSMDCITQSGDMASDPGGLFTPKKCELRTYANKSCRSGSIHECCKLGFFIFGGNKGLCVSACICAVVACCVFFCIEMFYASTVWWKITHWAGRKLN